MSRDDIDGFWGRRYHAGATVVAVSGSAKHNEVVRLAEEHFGDWESRSSTHDHAPASVDPHVSIRHRETEQTHLVIGGLGLVRGDERRFAFGLLSHILGGGMSSRLFREIREQRGLAYGVYTFRFPYADAGGFGVYVGTTPSQTDQVLELVKTEFNNVIGQGVTSEELDRAKGHVQGSLALTQEDPNNRMIRLGREEITGDTHLSLDETLARFDAVTLEDLQEIAVEFLGGPFVIGATGPNPASELESFIT
jgi:predicted Zn-dependent peptidase